MRILTLRIPGVIAKTKEKIISEINSIENVSECTELRLWEFRKKEIVAVGNVEVTAGSNKEEITKKIKEVMKSNSITTFTMQIDNDSLTDMRIA